MGFSSNPDVAQASPDLLLALIGMGARATREGVEWMARHPVEVAVCGGSAVALLQLRRELKETGLRIGPGKTLLAPTGLFLEAEMEKAQELAESAAGGRDAKAVFEKTIHLGSGDVALAKAQQIVSQFRFLESDADVLVAVGDSQDPLEPTVLTISTPGAVGWNTGVYSVAYRKVCGAGDSEGEGGLKMGLEALSNCGFRGILELRAEKDADDAVSFSAAILRARGRASARGKALVQKTLEAVEQEHAKMMRTYAANAKLRAKYQEAKLLKEAKARERQRDRVLNPDKYRPIRPGREAMAGGGGRWSPSSDLQDRRNPAVFVSTSSSGSCVQGS